MIRKAAFKHPVSEKFVVVWPFRQIEDHIILAMTAIQKASDLCYRISVQTLHASAWICHGNHARSDIAEVEIEGAIMKSVALARDKTADQGRHLQST